MKRRVPIMEYAVGKDGKYVLLFSTTKPEGWLQQISQNFGLNEIEKATLLSYLNHIHPETLDSFSRRLLGSPRSYLEPFIDNDLEEFGENMFSVDYDDLFDETPSGTRCRLVLYNSFVDNLKETNKAQREKQYANIGVSFAGDEDRKARRIKLYEAFVAKLRGMSKEEFEHYIKISSFE